MSPTACLDRPCLLPALHTVPSAHVPAATPPKRGGPRRPHALHSPMTGKTNPVQPPYGTPQSPPQRPTQSPRSATHSWCPRSCHVVGTICVIPFHSGDRKLTVPTVAKSCSEPLMSRTLLILTETLAGRPHSYLSFYRGGDWDTGKSLPSHSATRGRCHSTWTGGHPTRLSWVCGAHITTHAHTHLLPHLSLTHTHVNTQLSHHHLARSSQHAAGQARPLHVPEAEHSIATTV